MTMKSDKGKKSNAKHPALKADDKLVSKTKKNLKEEDDDDDLEDDETEVTSFSKKNGKPSASKKGKAKDEDDEEDDEEIKDDWEKPEEEEEWDPDFDEFDLPKSKGAKGKKVTGGAKKADDDDLKLDDEFKEMDLFDDRYDDDGEDDDY
jgi:DNA-directed RNA polymerase subunit delta